MMKVAVVCNFRAVGNHLKRLVEQRRLGKVVCMSVGDYHSEERILRSGAELVLMQTSLLKTDGLQLIKGIKKKMDAIFIGYALSFNFYQAMRYYDGELDSLILDDQEEEIQHRILQDSFYGKKVYPADFVSHKKYCEMEDQSLLLPFTSRERQLVTLMASGYTNKEMAGVMRCSRRTVETHRERIYIKTGKVSTAHLTKFAIAQGFLELV